MGNPILLPPPSFSPSILQPHLPGAGEASPPCLPAGWGSLSPGSCVQTHITTESFGRRRLAGPICSAEGHRAQTAAPWVSKPKRSFHPPSKGGGERQDKISVLSPPWRMSHPPPGSGDRDFSSVGEGFAHTLGFPTCSPNISHGLTITYSKGYTTFPSLLSNPAVCPCCLVTK